MNSLNLFTALAGGLLAAISFQRIEETRPPGFSKSDVIPAVVRVIEPGGVARIGNAATPFGWSSTERLREPDPEDFRNLTSREIETCALVIDAMMRRANQGTIGSRSYLHTRLQALREHVDYARSELIKLPSNQSDENFLPAYAHFYRTMRSLEQAFAQAATELNGDI
jgi:hypothetical protein